MDGPLLSGNMKDRYVNADGSPGVARFLHNCQPVPQSEKVR